MVALPPARVDRILDLLEPAGGARGEDDMRAGRGQRLGGGGADAAARAGDEGELCPASVSVMHPRGFVSASSENWSPGRARPDRSAWSDNRR